MKVSELIEQLKNYPESMRVILCHDDGSDEHTFKPTSTSKVMVCDGIEVVWVEMQPANP